MRHIFWFLFFANTMLFAQGKIQSPNEFLPHKLGDNFTPHHLLVDYFEYVDANSDAVQLQRYGYTKQTRPLLLAAISTKANMQNLETIRKDNLRRCGHLKDGVAPTTNIAIAWLSFSVHGNEAAGSEASMQVLFDLVNSLTVNNEISKWLENTVVLIDPSLNPDGYSRFTNWYRDVSGIYANVNADAREHQEPWPYGRVNHYLFDLNRDWAWLTQLESQYRAKVYHEWMPHIHPDFHEQGYNEPYYFAPAAQPYHTYITNWQREAQVGVGQNHAKYFDANGWLYFTKEIFDLLYPSYGDTYPTYNGAVGMTYEQGGIDAGRAIMTNNKDTLKLIDRITHHTATALSTVEYTSLNANNIVKNFEKYYNDAQSNPVGDYKTYILHGAPKKLKAISDLLSAHHIENGTTASGQKINGFNFNKQKENSFTTTAEDLVVSMYQPMSTLAQILLEPSVALVDSLTYDITAWSLPYAYGVECYALKQNIALSGGYKLAEAKQKLPNKVYAFAIKVGGLQDYKAILNLLSKKIQIRYNIETTSINGNTFSPGTYFLLRGDNADQTNFSELVSLNVPDAIPLTTGFADKGVDLGSAKLLLVKQPKIAVVYGEEVSNNEYGQVWHYFDNDLAYPFTPISLKQISTIDLSAYNTLILPEGYYNFDSASTATIQTWISKGGKLIAIGNGISSIEGKGDFAIAKKESKNKDEEKADEEDISKLIDHYSERERKALTNFIPGAIFKTTMDATNPYAYNVGSEYYSLKTGGYKYALLKKGVNVGYIEKNPYISGFVGAKLKEALNESLVLGVQEMGRGTAVYLVDNPLFRGFWYQGKMLFSNILLVN
ncbi:MAG: zinc carboxypeptidase [Saprospiraceae bacterium]|nr:zinc carboxypeptidase [Saprospiraceae bacterium]MBP7699180.1 zinc carboxypeptidase [Saprospiraceae bacterium]